MVKAARDIVTELFKQMSAGAEPSELAGYYAEDVDWFIPGNTAVVPWIGRKTGRAGVAEFFTQLRELTASGQFAVDTILGDGDRCVVLGSLRTEVLATGRNIDSDFAFDVAIRDGLITRYHMFEDTWAVATAVEPAAD